MALEYKGKFYDYEGSINDPKNFKEIAKPGGSITFIPDTFKSLEPGNYGAVQAGLKQIIGATGLNEDFLNKFFTGIGVIKPPAVSPEIGTGSAPAINPSNPPQYKATYLGGGTTKEGQAIPFTEFTGQSKEDIERQAAAAQINPANLYGEFWKSKASEPIQVSEPKSSAVTVARQIATNAAGLSNQMNQMLQKVKDSYDKAGGQTKANVNFVNAVANASKGRDATKEELNLAGKSLDEVLNFFGIADKVGGLVSPEPPTPEGRKIVNVEELQKLAKEGLRESDITRVGKEIFIKPDSEFLKRMSPLGEVLPPQGQTEPKGGTVQTTGEQGTAGQIQGQGGFLDKMQTLVDQFAANKKTATETAKTAEGVGAIQSEVNTAQTKANETLARIEATKSKLEATDILDEEAKIALTNKIRGETIPMATINKSLLAGLEDLNQAQRLQKLYDTYELNSDINLYNAELRNVSLLQGKYESAMENVKASVADWEEQQNLQMKILEEEGQLESEAKDRYQTEINYERGLMEKGYVMVSDQKTYNKLVSDLGVTAATFQNYFYKDSSSNKLYLRPSNMAELKTVFETAGGRRLMITYDDKANIIKQTDLGSAYKGTSGGGGGGSGTTPTTTPAIKLTQDEKNRAVALGIGSWSIEMQNVILNSLTTSQQKEFINDFNAEQKKRGQSLDPAIFIIEWAQKKDQESGSSITNPWQ